MTINIQKDLGKEKVLCVICHKPIDIKDFGVNESILEHNYVGCPNGHLVHTECLKEWILHSNKCPVCMEPYDMKVIQIFEEYIKQVKEDRKRLEEERKRMELERQKQKEKEKEFVGEDLEIFNKALYMIDSENYSEAVDLLWGLIDKGVYKDKDPRFHHILFHLGRTYYKMGNFMMAIRQLMKLVKLDFKYPLAFYFLGLSYEKVELPDKAVWAYERALKTVKELAEKDPYYNDFVVNIEQRLGYLRDMKNNSC